MCLPVHAFPGNQTHDLCIATSHQLTSHLTKTIKTAVKETYLTPSLWKGMRLRVSCGSTCERSASGGTGALDSLFSNWAEKDCSTAGGKGSISTAGSSLSSATKQKHHHQPHVLYFSKNKSHMTISPIRSKLHYWEESLTVSKSHIIMFRNTVKYWYIKWNTDKL